MYIRSAEGQALTRRIYATYYSAMRKSAYTAQERANPLFSIWQNIRNRCAPGSEYGKRGIRVCDRWQRSFRAFVEDMGPRPDETKTPGGKWTWTLDRVNTLGHYGPGNCRWATASMQARNGLRSLRYKRDNPNSYKSRSTGGRPIVSFTIADDTLVILHRLADEVLRMNRSAVVELAIRELGKRHP